MRACVTKDVESLWMERYSQAIKSKLQYEINGQDVHFAGPDLVLCHDLYHDGCTVCVMRDSSLAEGWLEWTLGQASVHP